MKTSVKACILSMMCSATVLVQMAVAHAAPPMETRTLMDQNGFDRPVPAFKVDVPKGWKLTGGVVWKPGACASTANQTEWQASAPNSPAQIAYFPSESWSWSSMLDEMPQFASQSNDGCPTARIFDAQTYMQMALQQRRPGAQIISMRPRPDAVQELQAKFGPMAQQYGMEVRFDSVQVLISYQMNGVEMRETLMANVQLTKSPLPDMYGGMSGYMVSGQSLGTISMKAPNGQLDFDLVENVRRSIRIDPAYEKRMASYYAGLNRPRPRPRGPSVQAGGNEVGDIIADGYRKRTAIQDSMHEKTVDVIRDEWGYVNTSGDIVKLPGGYDRTFETNDGGYIQTDDPSFDPYVDLGIEGTELEEQQY